MRISKDGMQALQAADDVIARVEPSVCPRCEGTCYSVAVDARGHLGGQGWSTTVHFRPHMRESEAYGWLGAVLSSIGSRLRAHEHQVWLREVQPTLW